MTIITKTALTLFITTLVSCGTERQKDATEKSRLEKRSVDAMQSDTRAISKSDIDKLSPDTIQLKETYNEDDIVANEYLIEQLKPIQKNFKRINSITSWTSTTKKDLWETTEGGEATFYYTNGALEKIITRHFGETFQQLSEYYLLNGQLSFVFEKSYQYNRPLYYDSASMKENNDAEVFDLQRSEISEVRSYFEKGNLIRQLNNQKSDAPFAVHHFSEEQQRLTTYFNKLVKPGDK